MENEVLLVSVHKYKKPEGFIKVSCQLEQPLDDEALKSEIVKSLIDSPCAEDVARLVQETCHVTKESAVKACLEIANDLLADVNRIEFPVFIEEEDAKKDTAELPELALQNSLQKVRKQKDLRSRLFRHPVVTMKQYGLLKTYYFYADPEKLNKGYPVRFVA